MSGWKLTPREATREMDVVGMEAVGFGDDTEAAWRAMSEAAPSPTEDVLERMARAYDKAIGISWARVDRDLADHAEFIAYRVKSMRAALAAAERGEQASISTKMGGR